MIKVYGVKPHHAGLGQYQCDCEGVELPEYDSAEEYAAAIASDPAAGVYSYAVDPDIAEMGDEDGEMLAAELRAAKDNVLGGHGTLVAFLFRDAFGSCVRLESVDVVTV